MKHLGFAATMKSIKRKRVEATSSDTAPPAKADTSKQVEAAGKRAAKAKAKSKEATSNIKPSKRGETLATELDGCLPPLGSFQGVYSDSD